ncbi:hypothetical protein, partial [Pelomonas sp. KK5]|uniref:hypothetical protein n=1 Tax=Pelomonas sp. KK5 TaxID=1855730 RepID=UPI001301F6E6
MDRLPEQVVEWHNRHPLAKRISIYDVHTIGVVALPFMRDSRPPMQVEPVLTDAVSDESLAAWGSEDSTVAANTNAAHLDALADQEDPPPGVAAPGKPTGLLARLLRRAPRAPGGSWPAFSERFLEKLSAGRVARFAQAHGYSVSPGDASWPHRVVAIDDDMLDKGGGWPFEIFLVTAAIDAGSSRTRILVGRSAGAQLPPMLGRRCLAPKRVALAALLPLLVVAAGGGALWRATQSHG